jgi:hypothetical protein
MFFFSFLLKIVYFKWRYFTNGIIIRITCKNRIVNFMWRHFTNTKLNAYLCDVYYKILPSLKFVCVQNRLISPNLSHTRGTRHTSKSSYHGGSWRTRVPPYVTWEPNLTLPINRQHTNSTTQPWSPALDTRSNISSASLQRISSSYNSQIYASVIIERGYCYYK